jgi:DNA polymerase III delta subunit
VVRSVAPGNALVFVDVRGDPRRETGSTDELRDAVRTSGGTVAEYRVPTREAMDRWISARAAELGVDLDRPAARLLAERVGAHVREGDVDRRNQSLLANAELQKLALYRPGGTIGRADVEALVPEAVPGSVWALLDAVASRRAREATLLVERLASGTALPILVSQLHRRLRELIVVRDRLAGGTRPQELPRLLKVQPFRAQKLAEHAATWTLAELEAALEGLVAVDLETKGLATDGRTISVSDERATLALEAWIAERVARGVRSDARAG